MGRSKGPLLKDLHLIFSKHLTWYIGFGSEVGGEKIGTQFTVMNRIQLNLIVSARYQIANRVGHLHIRTYIELLMQCLVKFTQRCDCETITSYWLTIFGWLPVKVSNLTRNYIDIQISRWIRN